MLEIDQGGRRESPEFCVALTALRTPSTLAVHLRTLQGNARLGDLSLEYTGVLVLGQFGSHVRGNVVGYIALFVALSGSAYAASQLPANSVGTKQLQKGAVTKAKLARGVAVSGPQGQTGPRGTQGPPGPSGQTGPRGTEGPPGPSTGPAGGDLSGQYPNPTIAPSTVGPSEFETLPAASIIDGAGNQTLPTGTTTIAFNSSVYDTDSMLDATGNQLVIHTPGKYLIQATIAIEYTGHSNAIRELFIEKNGGAVAIDTQDATVTPDSRETQTASVIVPLQANDTITAAVFQSTGSDATSVAVSAGGGEVAPVLQAEWLGP